MSLPESVLDDLQFQKVLDEARRRIVRHCPEWTDYNLSDPGITVLELQAWMTEMIVFRLNQVPEKNYVQFLNWLGEDLQPAQAARTNLTFYLAAPFPLRPGEPGGSQTYIPSGTAVASARTDESPEVIFTTDRACLVRGPSIKFVMRADLPSKNYWPEKKREDPAIGTLSEKMVAFGDVLTGAAPKKDDAFCIGFDADDPDHNLAGYVLRLHVGCANAGGAGVRKEDPPWKWECWGETDEGADWQPITLGSLPDERDTTGGLNYDDGSLVLYLPTTAVAAEAVHGRKAYWVRCSVKPVGEGDDNMYGKSPLITRLRAEVIGITLPATHSQLVKDEWLGVSNGEDGQRFQLQQTQFGQTLLPLDDEDTPAHIFELWRDTQGQVIEEDTQIWTSVDDFAHSDRYDRRFTLDRLTGEVCFGPAIVQPDGAMRQYGRVPPPGCELRIEQYRYGGGRAGNVPVGKLQELRTTVPFVDRVTNLERAYDGTDREELPHAQMRLRKSLWARRAVSGSDFEMIAKEVNGVARARFVPPPAGSHAGDVDVRIVPAVKVKDNTLPNTRTTNIIPLASLWQAALAQDVRAELDKRRLLTATLSVQAPTYVGVKVSARVRMIKNGLSADDVKRDVVWALRALLAPLNVLPEVGEHDWAVMRGTAETSLRNGVARGLSRATSANSPTTLQTQVRRFLEGYTSSEQSGHWVGWPFGRTLLMSDLTALMLRVPGVEEVLQVSIQTARFKPGDAGPTATTKLDGLNNPQLDLAAYEVLCSFDVDALSHAVEVVA